MDIRTVMIKQFLKIAGEKNKNLRLFIFIILFTFAGKAQTQSNLEIFYSLIDSAAVNASENISPIVSEVNVTLDLGIYYSIFENRILSRLGQNGLKVTRGTNSTQKSHHLNFIIDNASVNYGDQKRDGFLGDFHVTRNVTLSGNYLLTSDAESSMNELKEFSFTFNDMVKVEDIEKLENRSFPFTQGTLPPEPFFSSILEPVIAVSAAAAAVILFFSVRSK